MYNVEGGPGGPVLPEGAGDPGGSGYSVESVEGGPVYQDEGGAGGKVYPV